MTGILSGSTRGEIHRIVERHRLELLLLERGAASEMVRAYGGIWRRLKAELDRLLEDYNAALKANDEISPSWVYEHDRLYNLQRQVEAELRRFADYAEAQIIANEREAVTAASRHFQEILTTTARGRRGIVGAWDRLPTPAVEDLVGFTASGSPLRTLLDELGPAASEAVRSELTQGLALGQNPRAIARRIRKEFGGGLVRALRIARTETLRSYREATRRNYQASSDIIAGWRWLCAKQPRTCAMCLAMDGTFHTVDEHLDDHPNGRCAMVPVLKGEEGAPPGWETGSEWLDKQPEAVQRRVLGNAAFKAYKAGAVKLSDFVGQKSDRRWGTMRYTRSLQEIVFWSRPRLQSRSLTPQDHVLQMARRVADPLARRTGTANNWNGAIHVQRLRSGALGAKNWDCSIVVSRAIVRDAAELWPTIIHEMLHALSVGVDKASYRAFSGWEEGVVEKLQRILGPRALRAIGELPYVGLGAYDHYIAALERLRRFLGKPESRFYLQLLRIPLADRERAVIDMGQQLPADRQQEWQQVLADDLPILRRRR